MHHIRGVAREQIALLPPAIEDFVSVDHPVRVVDAFVESLDMAELGFGKAEPEATGRPPYDPADLLKLFLYGYLNRLRSSRVLERECSRNVELMWLMKRLRPDFKTIANFRKDNGEPLRGVCRAFVRWCGKQGLIGGEIVAIDGTKVQAAASTSRVVTPKGLERAIEQIDAKVERYLHELERNDAEEQEERDETRSTAEALKALAEQRSELQALAAQMIAEGRRHMVPGEGEAVLMGPGVGKIGYNLQSAVDSKNKLIVHHEVVSEANDRSQLYPMASGAKEALGADGLRVIADAGYHNGAQAQQCEDQQIEPAVPVQRTSNQYNEFFPKEVFTYDAATDTYICPAGAVMKPRKPRAHDQQRRYVTRACYTCPLRPHCTSGRQRKISRSLHENAATRADQRARESSAMRLRASLVEHPFAWVKRTLERRYLSRGLRSARAETALAVLSYNLLRVMNLIGARQMLELLPA